MQWNLEVVSPPPAHPPYRHALFDFDGTLSLIREGWRGVMVPYFAEVLSAVPGAPADAGAVVGDFVDRLTGKQTIFQCMRLDEEVVRAGGAPVDPLVYKAEYLRRLGSRIAGRLADLRAGGDPEKYLVTGALELLERLTGEGYTLYLASGTDAADVLAEARLLGLEPYFGERIYGAHDDTLADSKAGVIAAIMAEHHLTDGHIAGFGDGYVEIELIAGVGGCAIGVASDEARRDGIDARKRVRLTEAGAAAIIPDFAEVDAIMAFLKGA